MTTLFGKMLAATLVMLMAVGTGEWFLLHSVEQKAVAALTQLGAAQNPTGRREGSQCGARAVQRGPEGGN
jgi:hypothetical protein